MLGMSSDVFLRPCEIITKNMVYFLRCSLSFMFHICNFLWILQWTKSRKKCGIYLRDGAESKTLVFIKVGRNAYSFRPLGSTNLCNFLPLTYIVLYRLLFESVFDRKCSRNDKFFYVKFVPMQAYP